MTLSIRSLTQGYWDATILDSIDVEIERGEFVSVLGPNGSGKSTLIKTVCRVMKPRGGTITVDGEDITMADPKKFSRMIGYVPQRYITSDYMQVFNAVLVGRAPYMSWSYSKNDFAMASAAIDAMGLNDLMRKYTNDLSGGQLQKVIIARALAQCPDYYILDEPTSALDLRNQLDTLRAVKTFMTDRGAGALIALHDLNLAMRFSDKVVMLKDGHVHACGRPEDVITEKNISDVYNVSSEIVEGRDGTYVHICEDRPDRSAIN